MKQGLLLNTDEWMIFLKNMLFQFMQKKENDYSTSSDQTEPSCNMTVSRVWSPTGLIRAVRARPFGL